MQAAALRAPVYPPAQVPETEKLGALRVSLAIEYPVVDDGCVQSKALHPENLYGPALVQTDATAEPS